MFRKILITTMFATAAGYCFAADTGVPQVVTSQVFYDVENVQPMPEQIQTETVQTVTSEELVVQEEMQIAQPVQEIPAWPLKGSDADMNIEQAAVSNDYDNVKIVSKIGADLVVENNFNLGVRAGSASWSGGANMLHGSQLPAGFQDDCNTKAEMPLLNREMLEDDGGAVLSVSRSARKNCGNSYRGASVGSAVVLNEEYNNADTSEIAVDESSNPEMVVTEKDQARSWVVARGQTLRDVLQTWCDKEGWDLVWTTSREYPIEASAVFKGRFTDVTSALVRNFSRATPIPYAKFYKGNRVLVISTIEE